MNWVIYKLAGQDIYGGCQSDHIHLQEWLNDGCTLIVTGLSKEQINPYMIKHNMVDVYLGRVPRDDD